MHSSSAAGFGRSSAEPRTRPAQPPAQAKKANARLVSAGHPSVSDGASRRSLGVANRIWRFLGLLSSACSGSFRRPGCPRDPAWQPRRCVSLPADGRPTRLEGRSVPTPAHAHLDPVRGSPGGDPHRRGPDGVVQVVGRRRSLVAEIGGQRPSTQDGVRPENVFPRRQSLDREPSVPAAERAGADLHRVAVRGDRPDVAMGQRSSVVKTKVAGERPHGGPPSRPRTEQGRADPVVFGDPLFRSVRARTT